MAFDAVFLPFVKQYAMTDAQLMEQFSIHLVKMMASLAGCVIGTTNLDNGVDFQVRQVEKLLYPGGRRRFFLSGKAVDVQLKTTSTFEYSDDETLAKFDLDVKNYNDLVTRREAREEHSDIIIPLLLLVHCIPVEREEWMVVSQKEINLKGSIFWHYPEPTEALSGKKAKQRIFIPTKNHVNLKFFEELFGRFYKRSEK